jgi:formamidopyrimidine-DNA glycosylase
MPELPELQALVERLTDTFGGATLARAEALQFSAIKTVRPDLSALEGKTLGEVTRRGKYLIFDFGALHVLVHLSQGGRVFVEQPPRKTRPKGSVMRFTFDERPSLLVLEYGTERKAAWWVLEKDDPGPLEGLGPEPSSPEFERLVEASDDRRRLHTLLRDQKTVAGIGRGFADDILHTARLSPFSSLHALTKEQRRSLLDAVRAVLEDGLTRERERTGGLPPKLGDRFAVHGRFGGPCPRCGASLARVSYESHEIAYCPACQTEGKVLADRRLSRLLR